MSPIDRFSEIPSTSVHDSKKEVSRTPTTAESATSSIASCILEQRPPLGVCPSLRSWFVGDTRGSTIKPEPNKKEFLETLLFGDLLSLEKLLITKQISPQLIQIGLKMAFRERKVVQFYLLEQYFEGDVALFEELFYLELSRGGDRISFRIGG